MRLLLTLLIVAASMIGFALITGFIASYLEFRRDKKMRQKLADVLLNEVDEVEKSMPGGEKLKYNSGTDQEPVYTGKDKFKAEK